MFQLFMLPDSGVPVLNMHAPEELINKADLYEAVKAYEAFMKYACPVK